MKYIIAIFVIVPALEIGLFVLSGNIIGILPTVALIVLTGIAGAYLAKREGLETFRKAQRDMSYGQLPGQSIIDGICIFIGGLLLLSPGFITDTIGFLLLLPLTRNWFKPLLNKIGRNMINKGQFRIIQ